MIRRYGTGSAAACLRAVREARRGGATLVFMHQDDNVYVPLAGKLLGHAVTAFERKQDLLAVRLTCYPILDSTVSSAQGNRTFLEQRGDEIRFDVVTLRAERFEDFTLWWSPFGPDSNRGTFWPIIMWQVVYRAEFLEQLLSAPEVGHCRHLSGIEAWYRDRINYTTYCKKIRGSFGFINMQFAGFEMHQADTVREGLWQEILVRPNVEVR